VKGLSPLFQVTIALALWSVLLLLAGAS